MEIVTKSSLGNCIDTLINFNEDFAVMYKHSTLGIKTNQWRNIANHNSYSLKNETTIIATYGSNNQHEILLSRKQIEQVSLAISCFYNLHKIAHTLIFIDNYDLFSSNDVSYTDDSVFAQVIETTNLYGFKVTDFEEHDKLWIFGLDYNSADIKKSDPNVKMIIKSIASIIRKTTYLIIRPQDNSRLVKIQINPISSSSNKLICHWEDLK